MVSLTVAGAGTRAGAGADAGTEIANAASGEPLSSSWVAAFAKQASPIHISASSSKPRPTSGERVKTGRGAEGGKVVRNKVRGEGERQVGRSECREGVFPSGGQNSNMVEVCEALKILIAHMLRREEVQACHVTLDLLRRDRPPRIGGDQIRLPLTWPLESCVAAASMQDPERFLQRLPARGIEATQISLGEKRHELLSIQSPGGIDLAQNLLQDAIVGQPRTEGGSVSRHDHFDAVVVEALERVVGAGKPLRASSDVPFRKDAAEMRPPEIVGKRLLSCIRPSLQKHNRHGRELLFRAAHVQAAHVLENKRQTGLVLELGLVFVHVLDDVEVAT
mmetsp:Transcript_36074/g.77792  ORF Transcript_36074/g.77792 Transcript_36074/m.77792 type:complete len:335 (-) Transcript_36074:1608-2612(-)